MPRDLILRADGSARIDLDKLYDPFMMKVLDVLAACRKRGQDYFPTHGYRSFSEQAKLYFQGRTTPGKIVTNARAGFSAHNYGLAVDVCADSDPAPGLQASWDPKRYIVLGHEARKAGLIWGDDFNDKPHIQWPGFVNGSQLKVLYNLWQSHAPAVTESQRLTATWLYLDSLPVA